MSLSILLLLVGSLLLIGGTVIVGWSGWIGAQESAAAIAGANARASEANARAAALELKTIELREKLALAIKEISARAVTEKQRESIKKEIIGKTSYKIFFIPQPNDIEGRMYAMMLQSAFDPSAFTQLMRDNFIHAWDMGISATNQAEMFVYRPLSARDQSFHMDPVVQALNVIGIRSSERAFVNQRGVKTDTLEAYSVCVPTKIPNYLGEDALFGDD